MKGRYNNPMPAALFLSLLLSVPPLRCADPAPCTADFTAEMDEGDGLINFGKVSDELYRSGQPVHNREVDGYKRLQQLGIRTVIDLRTFSGMEPEIIRELNVLTPQLSKRIYYLHLSIDPFSSDVDYLNGRIDTLLTAIRNSPKPVLVHCKYGQERTAFVVALYQMVACGFTYDQALKNMELCHYRPYLGGRHFTKFLEWWVRYRLPELREKAK